MVLRSRAQPCPRGNQPKTRPSLVEHAAAKIHIALPRSGRSAQFQRAARSWHMLRRAAIALTGGGGAAGAYGYKWANDNLGSDALDRIVQVRLLACDPWLQM